MKTEKTSAGIKNAAPFAAVAAFCIAIAIGLISQPFTAEAQGPFGPARSSDEVVQLLTDRLDLTEEQAAALRPVIEEKVQRRNEIWENAGSDRRAVRVEMQKLRWDTEKKLGDILTDEQVESYLEFRQEQRAVMGREKFRGPGMDRGLDKTPDQIIDRMKVRLDLSEEQAAEVQPIIEESITKRRDVYDKYRDQGLGARQSMREEMLAIGDETHAELSAVLTDEQVEELNAIQERRRARADRCIKGPGPMGF